VDAIVARPGHVLCPTTGQLSRRPNGHSRSFALTRRESKSQCPPSGATKSRDPDLATWLTLLHPLLPCPGFSFFSFRSSARSYLKLDYSSLFQMTSTHFRNTGSFLNGLPLLNETAERWLREGLHGGEPEFLDHPTQWQDPPPFKKHIDAGDGTTVGSFITLACLSNPSLTRGCLSYCKASASQVDPGLHNRIDENGSS